MNRFGELKLEDLTFDERGLLPVVVQDIATGAVLMVAWADREALIKTRETGLAHFWSRSRQKLWQKGETSGNVLQVESVLTDCDADTLIYRADPTGPACHRGTRTCFEPNPAKIELGWLWEVLESRKAAGDTSSYTARLLAKGRPRIAQKVGEEATEVVIAALSGENEELIGESADLLYHLLVLLLERGIDPQQVVKELRSRHASRTRTSGKTASSENGAKKDATNQAPTDTHVLGRNS